MPQDFGKVVYGGYHQNVGLGNALLQGVGGGLSKGLASGLSGIVGDLLHEDPQAAVYKEQAAGLRQERIAQMRKFASDYALKNPALMADPTARGKFLKDLSESAGLPEFSAVDHPLWSQTEQEQNQQQFGSIQHRQRAQDSWAESQFPQTQPTTPATGGGASIDSGRGAMSAGSASSPVDNAVAAGARLQPPARSVDPTGPEALAAAGQVVDGVTKAPSVPTAAEPNVSVPPPQIPPNEQAQLQAAALHALSRIKAMDMASDPHIMASKEGMELILGMGQATEKSVNDAAAMALSAMGHNPDVPGTNVYRLGFQMAQYKRTHDPSLAPAALRQMQEQYGEAEGKAKFDELSKASEQHMEYLQALNPSPTVFGLVQNVSKEMVSSNPAAVLQYLSADKQIKQQGEQFHDKISLERAMFDKDSEHKDRQLLLQGKQIDAYIAAQAATTLQRWEELGLDRTKVANQVAAQSLATRLEALRTIQADHKLQLDEHTRTIMANTGLLQANTKQEQALTQDLGYQMVLANLQKAKTKEAIAAIEKTPEYKKFLVTKAEIDMIAQQNAAVRSSLMDQTKNEIKLNTSASSYLSKLKALGIPITGDEVSDYQTSLLKQAGQQWAPKLKGMTAADIDRVALADPVGLLSILPGTRMVKGDLRGTVLSPRDIRFAANAAADLHQKGVAPTFQEFSQLKAPNGQTLSQIYGPKVRDVYDAMYEIKGRL